MTIMLPALGITFAAFSILLVLRIVYRRERWAIRLGTFFASIGMVLVAVAALLLYWLKRMSG